MADCPQVGEQALGCVACVIAALDGNLKLR